MQKNIVWTLVQGIVKIWGLATGLIVGNSNLLDSEISKGGIIFLLLSAKVAPLSTSPTSWTITGYHAFLVAVIYLPRLNQTTRYLRVFSVFICEEINVSNCFDGLSPVVHPPKQSGEIVANISCVSGLDVCNSWPRKPATPSRTGSPRILWLDLNPDWQPNV